MSETSVQVEAQLQKRLVGHAVKDSDDGVYVGRGYNGEHVMRSDVEIGERGWLGNPFKIGEDIELGGDVVVQDATREDVVEWFEKVFVWRLEQDVEFRRAVAELAGEPVDCWCQERGVAGPACHGEVIVKWAAQLGGV